MQGDAGSPPTVAFQLSSPLNEPADNSAAAQGSPQNYSFGLTSVMQQFLGSGPPQHLRRPSDAVSSGTPLRSERSAHTEHSRRTAKGGLTGGLRVGERVRDITDGVSGVVLGPSSDPRNRHERVRVKQTDGGVWNILVRNLSSQVWKEAREAAAARTRRAVAVPRRASTSGSGQQSPTPRAAVTPRTPRTPRAPWMLLPCPSSVAKPAPRQPPTPTTAAVHALPPSDAAAVASALERLVDSGAASCIRGGFAVSGVLKPRPPPPLWKKGAAMAAVSARCGAPPSPQRRGAQTHRPRGRQRHADHMQPAGKALVRGLSTPDRHKAAGAMKELRGLLDKGSRLAGGSADVVADAVSLCESALTRAGMPVSEELMAELLDVVRPRVPEPPREQGYVPRQRKPPPFDPGTSMWGSMRRPVRRPAAPAVPPRDELVEHTARKAHGTDALPPPNVKPPKSLSPTSCCAGPHPPAAPPGPCRRRRGAGAVSPEPTAGDFDWLPFLSGDGGGQRPDRAEE